MFFFKDATQKSARVVLGEIEIELVPREPIFEKCSDLREKGGVLTLRTSIGFALTHTVLVNQVHLLKIPQNLYSRHVDIGQLEEASISTPPEVG